MTQRKFALACLVFLGLSVLAAAIPSIADLSGTWAGRFRASHSEDDDLTLVLTKSETGYVGTLNDALGYLKKDTPITDVKTEGKTIRFQFVIIYETGESQDLGLNLTLDGERLTGTLEYKAKGGGEPVEFIRKK